ncbi:MAG TPA: hypothetical protein VD928_00335 [Candidatus Paceibacterota bacterium]|nr:hypothetical protein [Candidatus Paceibacterota bacterium]
MPVNPANLSRSQLEEEIMKALMNGHWNYLGSVADIARMKIRNHFAPPPDVWIWHGADGDEYDFLVHKFNDLEINLPYRVREQPLLQRTVARLMISQILKPRWWKRPLSSICSGLLKFKARH